MSTQELRLVFVVEVSFPDSQDAATVSTTKKVTTIEFLLLKAGILTRRT